MAEREKDVRVALVTGASSGIGEALAEQFARDGWHLVLVARDAARLQAVGERLAAAHGTRFLVVAADLSVPSAPERLRQAVDEAGWRVDALVNNAGFGLYGPLVRVGAEEPTALDGELRMIQLNVAALTHLTKLFLPDMVARGSGYVLNVASTAAFQPGPLMAVYYASKAYVLSFSQAVAAEVAGSGVRVTCLCPGATRTEFGKVADMERSRLFNAPHVMDAERVARIGYRGMLAGRRVVVPGIANKVMAQGTRFVPRRVATWFARKGQERV